eukprot:TRINITY_DN50252_c0_g1_i1.p1 TRINITY_DN50252_c0_g1~~TRINITY_DN50252_c0_g1_i1.p1  ORF type:complete len:185 (-),score=30.26 TRINITY_DN50252_c0_g1_i1:158-712(-)
MGADFSTTVVSVIEVKDGSQPVKCACTPLNKAFFELIPAAYHTSIAIGDMEYSFDSSGVTSSPVWLSHSLMSPDIKSPAVVLHLGFTNVHGGMLADILNPHFRPGTYDLLLKNCNAFSNAALFFLLGTQLDDKYTALERAGAVIDKRSGLVQMLSMGGYIPNPKATDFQLDKVLALLQAGNFPG